MGDIITIIVPVYNVKKYLEKCVNSIINQTYSDLEIFLIDDGSTDGSGELCDYFSQKDRRIKVIHKSNGGLSSARNAAIDVMSGKYVTFVDSDDYVDEKYIEKLYGLVKKFDAQISVCGEKRFTQDEKGDVIFRDSPYVKLKNEKVLNTEEGIETILKQHYFDASAWGKLYLSSLFLDVRYPEGKNHEDIGTTYKLFMRASNIAFISDPLYFYMQRPESILHSFNNVKTLWDGIEMVEMQYKGVINVYPKLETAAIVRCFSMYCRCFKFGKLAKNSEIEEYSWKKITTIRRTIINSKNTRKKARYAAILSLLGRDLFGFLICRM